MGFADTDAAPNEEGIVGKTGVFDNALGGGIGKIVAVADDKMVESVVGMEIGGIDFGRGGEGKQGRGGSGIFGRGNNFLNNENKDIVVFGLIVKSFFEELIVALTIEIDNIGIGTGNGGGMVFEGKQLSAGDESLKDSRIEDDFHFLLNIFPKTVEIHGLVICNQ